MSAAEDRATQPPALSVIAGLTYLDHSQVFNRWFLPTYRTSFRWTGNRSDAEDATSWVFTHAVGRMQLPQSLGSVDDRVTVATLQAASRHWTERYGIDPMRCSEIHACEAAFSGGAASSLEALVAGLSAEMRLVIVLRFLRRRSLSAIATQMRFRPGSANVYLYTALSGVAERIGLDAYRGMVTQADQVAAFVDALICKQRPLRFEAGPAAWAALLAATHIQAAVAGNNLPRARFVRSLEETFQTGRRRRHVTHPRIWTA